MLVVRTLIAIGAKYSNVFLFSNLLSADMVLFKSEFHISCPLLASGYMMLPSLFCQCGSRHHGGFQSISSCKQHAIISFLTAKNETAANNKWKFCFCMIMLGLTQLVRPRGRSKNSNGKFSTSIILPKPCPKWFLSLPPIQTAPKWELWKWW